MKIKLIISILTLIILFSGACKSKPAPVANTQPINTASSASQSQTGPSATGVNTTAPNTTTGNTYGGTSSGSSNRNQNGIILDGAVSYTVVRGDTLNRIARRHYGDGSLYPLITMATDIINDVDKIYPRMVLTLPALRANMDDPTARQNINRYFLQIANIEEQRGRIRTAALIRGHTRQ